MATFNIGEAKTRLSELVAKVEAGEEVIIARGNVAVARLTPFDDAAPRRQNIEAALAARKSPGMKAVSKEELVDWKHKGHRY